MPDPTTLPESPNAKTSRLCGILSVVFSCTCIGFPIAIIIGIIAILKNSKAKRDAFESPQEFRNPTNTGLTLGIIGLVVSIVIALPTTIIAGSMGVLASSIHNKKQENDKLIQELNNVQREFSENQIKLAAIEQQELDLKVKQQELEMLLLSKKASDEKTKLLSTQNETKKLQEQLAHQKEEARKVQDELNAKVDALSKLHN